MKRLEKVRLKDKRRRASYVTVALYASLAVAVLGGVAYASRLPEVSVTTVQVEGATHLSVAEVQEIVEKKLSGTYGLLIPKRLAYVVPKGTLRAAVIEAFPVVQSVDVTRTSLTDLTVEVTERQASALWCSTTCFRMDEYGFLFDYAQTSDSLREYRGGEYSIGKVFMEGSFHDFARFVADVEHVSGTGISKVKIEGGDGFLLLDTGGEIRIRMNEDFDELRNMLTAMFGSDEFKKGKKLDYVELRFGKKAVVKFD